MFNAVPLFLTLSFAAAQLVPGGARTMVHGGNKEGLLRMLELFETKVLVPLKKTLKTNEICGEGDLMMTMEQVSKEPHGRPLGWSKEAAKKLLCRSAAHMTALVQWSKEKRANESRTNRRLTNFFRKNDYEYLTFILHNKVKDIEFSVSQKLHKLVGFSKRVDPPTRGTALDEKENQDCEKLADHYSKKIDQLKQLTDNKMSPEDRLPYEVAYEALKTSKFLWNYLEEDTNLTWALQQFTADLLVFALEFPEVAPIANGWKIGIEARICSFHGGTDGDKEEEGLLHTLKLFETKVLEPLKATLNEKEICEENDLMTIDQIRNAKNRGKPLTWDREPAKKLLCHSFNHMASLVHWSKGQLLEQVNESDISLEITSFFRTNDFDFLKHLLNNQVDIEEHGIEKELEKLIGNSRRIGPPAKGTAKLDEKEKHSCVKLVDFYTEKLDQLKHSYVNKMSPNDQLIVALEVLETNDWLQLGYLEEDTSATWALQQFTVDLLVFALEFPEIAPIANGWKLGIESDKCHGRIDGQNDEELLRTLKLFETKILEPLKKTLKMNEICGEGDLMMTMDQIFKEPHGRPLGWSKEAAKKLLCRSTAYMTTMVKEKRTNESRTSQKLTNFFRKNDYEYLTFILHNKVKDIEFSVSQKLHKLVGFSKRVDPPTRGTALDEKENQDCEKLADHYSKKIDQLKQLTDNKMSPEDRLPYEVAYEALKTSKFLWDYLEEDTNLTWALQQFTADLLVFALEFPEVAPIANGWKIGIEARMCSIHGGTDGDKEEEGLLHTLKLFETKVLEPLKATLKEKKVCRDADLKKITMRQVSQLNSHVTLIGEAANKLLCHSVAHMDTVLQMSKGKLEKGENESEISQKITAFFQKNDFNDLMQVLKNEVDLHEIHEILIKLTDGGKEQSCVKLADHFAAKINELKHSQVNKMSLNDRIKLSLEALKTSDWLKKGYLEEDTSVDWVFQQFVVDLMVFALKFPEIAPFADSWKLGIEADKCSIHAGFDGDKDGLLHTLKRFEMKLLEPLRETLTKKEVCGRDDLNYMMTIKQIGKVDFGAMPKIWDKEAAKVLLCHSATHMASLVHWSKGELQKRSNEAGISQNISSDITKYFRENNFDLLRSRLLNSEVGKVLAERIDPLLEKLLEKLKGENTAAGISQFCAPTGSNSENCEKKKEEQKKHMCGMLAEHFNATIQQLKRQENGGKTDNVLHFVFAVEALLTSEQLHDFLIYQVDTSATWALQQFAVDLLVFALEFPEIAPIARGWKLGIESGRCSADL